MATERPESFRSFSTTAASWGIFPGAHWPDSVWLEYALDAAKGSVARDKARTAYWEFLTLWKDADPDIPILREAKSEYAKLE
jgi:hypothetical protein